MSAIKNNTVSSSPPFNATHAGAILALEAFNHLMPRDIWHWRDDLINKHPGLKSELITDYLRIAKKSGYVAANLNLLRTDKLLTTKRFSSARMRLLDCPADLDDDDIRALAKDCAEQCNEVFQSQAGNDFNEAVELVQSQCSRLEVDFPYKPSRNDSAETSRNKLAGACARCCDESWWRRKLRKKLGRQVEQVLRKIGSVKKARQPYLSGWAFKRWRAAEKRNRHLLESMVAENEKGYSLTLAGASDSSISNPVNRRHELMVRMRGFEEIASATGLVGRMLTLTCPGAYHVRHYHGSRNSSYNGATPGEAMDYLNGVWSKIRAKWKRLGIKPYGFRVVEPHHDGTPHWHLLLFFSASDADTAWQIFHAYALEKDGDEPGAQEHRADCTVVDESIGSATGYIAKYISKNIDGYQVDVDEDGDLPGQEGAARARAWASLWGIRQFQQIGTVSVTVWRELRRKKKPLEQWEPEEAETVRQACDSGDWARFVQLMGGPTLPRDEQVLRPLHFCGGEQHSRYGEEIKRIIGVVMRGVKRFIKTREHTWTIKHVPRTCEIQERAPPAPLDLCQ